MEEHFWLEEGTLVIRMPKEVDHHMAAKLRVEADRMIDAYPVRKLVFDFKETEFMDSSGIGVVIGRSRNMGYHGGEVFARNLSSRMEKIFLVSGLHKIIKTESKT